MIFLELTYTPISFRPHTGQPWSSTAMGNLMECHLFLYANIPPMPINLSMTEVPTNVDKRRLGLRSPT